MALPNKGSSDPDFTNDYPPTRDVFVVVQYGDGEFDFANQTVNERDDHTSLANSYDLGLATNAIDTDAEISIGIRAGTSFAPVILGWRERTWNGSSFSDTNHTTLLTTTPEVFPYDDTTGSPPYTYRDNFKLWRDL